MECIKEFEIFALRKKAKIENLKNAKKGKKSEKSENFILNFAHVH